MVTPSIWNVTPPRFPLPWVPYTSVQVPVSGVLDPDPGIVRVTLEVCWSPPPARALAAPASCTRMLLYDSSITWCAGDVEVLYVVTLVKWVWNPSWGTNADLNPACVPTATILDCCAGV